MIAALYIAGLLQLLIAASNFFAPRMLRYRENLARLDATVREVFVIQCIYLVMMLIAFAALCFAFPHELTSGSLLGRAISTFLAFFWGLRLLLQFIHYNEEIKRKHPVFNVLFLAAFLVLTGIFGFVAVR